MRALTFVLLITLAVSSCSRPADAPAQAAPDATQSPSSSASASASSSAQASPAGSSSPVEQLPQYRPALLGLGPDALINRINVAGLVKQGQKDASVMFCCSVLRSGELAARKIYRGTRNSDLLQQELGARLDRTRFIPAVYNHERVDALFYGTVTFAIANGKPRLRIFANQEAAELKNESDFIAPQPFGGRGSGFDGLHYPTNGVTTALSGIVDLALKVDAAGNLKEARILKEEPPLVGFGRAAAEDFRVAKFIPAFRDGKPVECSITLPVYYEP